MHSKGGGIMVNSLTKSSQKSVHIEQIQINFPGSKQAVLSITTSKGQRQVVVQYSSADFLSETDRILRQTVQLSTLDVQAVFNLLQVKLVDNLLVKSMKKGMQAVNNIKAKQIVAGVNREERFRSMKNVPAEEKKGIKQEIQQRATDILNQIASKEMKKIEGRGQFILDINKRFPMEVFERTNLIEKTKNELLDNLHRKYILAVNQIIEINKGKNVPESHLARNIEELIDNL